MLYMLSIRQKNIAEKKTEKYSFLLTKCSRGKTGLIGHGIIIEMLLTSYMTMNKRRSPMAFAFITSVFQLFL